MCCLTVKVSITTALVSAFQIIRSSGGIDLPNLWSSTRGKICVIGLGLFVNYEGVPENILVLIVVPAQKVFGRSLKFCFDVWALLEKRSPLSNFPGEQRHPLTFREQTVHVESRDWKLLRQGLAVL